MKKKDYSKFALGVALVILGVILVSGKLQLTENIIANSFAQEPVEVIGFTNFEVDEARIAKKIVIPSVSIDLAVKKSAVKGGYWEVFADSAGWGEGSGLPGEAGNQVIFAHAREGLFLPLRKIQEGESIYVVTNEGWYSYEVIEIKEVFPNQTEVIKPTEDERVRVYIWFGLRDYKRLIVVAKRI
jgi:LPXTG-site transpeptidase (sortase) family protein